MNKFRNRNFFLRKHNLLPGILCIVISLTHAQVQLSEDTYTRYELLDPASHSFRIIYEVSCTSPGVLFYYNTLRKGSDHKIDSVTDLMTGKPLSWKIVNGTEAKKTGYQGAEPDETYLQIKLARPVPFGGEYRIKIDKTYTDVKSYYSQDEKIIFQRSLGIKRNAILLPIGYELTGCNYPSQVVMEQDGRIKVSFINTGDSEVSLMIKGQKISTWSKPVIRKQEQPNNSTGLVADKSKARLNYQFPERAHQDREIVYFLLQPETNSFRLYHDYTETREGIDRYINIVRSGSKVSRPSAKNLDTGVDLKVETLKGEAISKRGLDIGEQVTPETEIAVVWFNPIKKGETMRLRIEETYTDPNRYLLNNGELVWDRSLGRPFNQVYLPEGWLLTASSIPGVIHQTQEGIIGLTFVNPSPDEINVFIKAKKK